MTTISYPLGRTLRPSTQLQEQMVETPSRQLTVGVVKESVKGETRVALTPETVEKLVSWGFRVQVQKQAGSYSSYADRMYQDAGAFLVEKSEIFKSNILLKILPLTLEEIELCKGSQYVFSFLPKRGIQKIYLEKMMAKRMTAIAYEDLFQENGVPMMDVWREMVGKEAVLLAGNSLSKMQEGKGVLLGGISGLPPTEVIVLGTDTAAEVAVKSLLGLSAFVRVFDTEVSALQRLQHHVGQSLYTSVLHPQVLHRAMDHADLILCFLSSSENQLIITREEEKGMKKGSVIMDLTAGRFPVFETMNDHPAQSWFEQDGIFHFCSEDVTSLVPRTFSMALSNVLSEIFLLLMHKGGMSSLMKQNDGWRRGIYMWNGMMVNEGLAKQFGYPYKDLGLLFYVF